MHTSSSTESPRVRKTSAKSSVSAAKKPSAAKPSAGSKTAKAPKQAAHLATQGPATDDMIATAAYYLAEARCFAPGHELEDWLVAESRIKARHS